MKTDSDLDLVCIYMYRPIYNFYITGDKFYLKCSDNISLEVERIIPISVEISSDLDVDPFHM